MEAQARDTVNKTFYIILSAYGRNDFAGHFFIVRHNSLPFLLNYQNGKPLQVAYDSLNITCVYVLFNNDCTFCCIVSAFLPFAVSPLKFYSSSRISCPRPLKLPILKIFYPAGYFSLPILFPFSAALPAGHYKKAKYPF
jgi:ankyrin repeat protein